VSEDPVDIQNMIFVGAANGSKGPYIYDENTHAEWFQRAYCLENGISAETVAAPVQEYFLGIADR
jgi:hypothetical protein